ncbi:MAG: uncharacterized protein H6R18_745 [Proteobacteria bacterium]|nr:uncharacterized protein [Pseudomonadota bacterium]
MALSRLGRWLIGLFAAVLVLALLLAGSFYFATQTLKTKVQEALGSNGEIGEIRVGFSAIEILDVRVKAAKGWPVADELRARRVVIKPDLRALVSKQIRISHIQIEDAYLSLLRRKDGKMLILPSLLAKVAENQKAASEDGKTPSEQSSASSLAVHLGEVTLSGGAVEFFDATVRQKPHKLSLEQVNVRLGKIKIPDLTGRTDIDVQAVVKGVRHDGKMSIKGNAEFSSRDSEILARLQGVDLVTFQPYLIKAAETGVRRGSLDLDIRSTVRKNWLNAPGTMTLSGMELAPGGSFMGMPRAVVVSMLKDKSGKITVKFTLSGNINDPAFSLNESFYGQVASSVAGALGISLGGLAQGVGSLGGGAVKGLGDTVDKIFGKR